MDGSRAEGDGRLCAETHCRVERQVGLIPLQEVAEKTCMQSRNTLILVSLAESGRGRSAAKNPRERKWRIKFNSRSINCLIHYDNIQTS